MLDHAHLPPLLTDLEAAAYLRLTDDAPSDDAALKRLNRIVDHKLLRPCIVGKRRRYSVRELERFIDAQTERYGALHG